MHEIILKFRNKYKLVHQLSTKVINLNFMCKVELTVGTSVDNFDLNRSVHHSELRASLPLHVNMNHPSAVL